MSTDNNNQLQLVSDLIDELMAELGHLTKSPASREEIIQQIIRLGALYRAIRIGDDLFVQAR